LSLIEGYLLYLIFKELIILYTPSTICQELLKLLLTTLKKLPLKRSPQLKDPILIAHFQRTLLYIHNFFSLSTPRRPLLFKGLVPKKYSGNIELDLSIIIIYNLPVIRVEKTRDPY